MTSVALALALAGVAAVAAAYGFSAFAQAWKHVHFGWLALTVAADVLAIGGYVVSYRQLARMDDGPRLGVSGALRLVIAGFGPFAPAGGFALDKRAFHALEGDERSATVRVLGLGALEWALLAPATCIAAVVLLATGDRRPLPSLLWPWALAVPIGFVVGLWLAAPPRRRRITAGKQRWRQPIGRALEGVGVLPSLARDLPSCWPAWIGTAVYWAFDIAAFYGAVRFVSLEPSVGELILAYATGYALTRRSMPLGGAAVTEVLMTFALHWVGQPVLPALAAVVVYRVFNFGLPAAPALLVRRQIQPLLTAADRGGLPTQEFLTVSER